MLNVSEGNLVVEEKGIYSVEKFLVARRLMYWQVYLHKTVIASDAMLISILQRARQLAMAGSTLGTYHPLMHFLFKDVNASNFDNEALDLFLALDDIDIMSSLKQWQFHEDKILSVLCGRMLNRQLPKIKIGLEPITDEIFTLVTQQAANLFGISEALAAEFFIKKGILENHAYKTEGGGIRILRKNGKIQDVAEASDNYNLAALKETVTKFYMIYWEK